MILHGTNPVEKDRRDYSFHRTFGSVTTFPDNFSVDAGFGVPNQELPYTLFDIPALPFGCTGYSSSELCQDQDTALVNPKTIYDNTCSAEGHDETQGCDIRDSLSSLSVLGIEYLNETSSSHNRTAYFNVQPGNGLDAFDAIRSSMYLSQSEKRAVSIGTPWLHEWATLSPNGIVPDFYTYDGNPGHYAWHNWVICGWITIDGIPYLQAKTHQGSGYGANGFSYYPRVVINNLFTIDGVAAFLVTKLPLTDVQTIKLSLYERLVFTLKEWYQAILHHIS